MKRDGAATCHADDSITPTPETLHTLITLIRDTHTLTHIRLTYDLLRTPIAHGGCAITPTCHILTCILHAYTRHARLDDIITWMVSECVRYDVCVDVREMCCSVVDAVKQGKRISCKLCMRCASSDMLECTCEHACMLCMLCILCMLCMLYMLCNCVRVVHFVHVMHVVHVVLCVAC